jgi:hypothetical protein
MNREPVSTSVTSGRVRARGNEGTTGAQDRLAWYTVTSSPHAIDLYSNSPYGGLNALVRQTDKH